MDFLPSIELGADQAHAMARALYTLAATDGVHEEEARLIDAFAGADGPPPHAPITPAELAAALPTATQRVVFLKTALLVAHADGSVTDAERTLLHDYAAAMDVSGLELLALEWDLLKLAARA